MAEDKVVEEIRRRGGAVYVWPHKDCCSGTFTLDASLLPPARDVSLVANEPLKVFAPTRAPAALNLGVLPIALRVGHPIGGTPYTRA